MSEDREAIRQELLRRGVQLERAPISNEREAIAAELRRRGVTIPAPKRSFTPEEESYYGEKLAAREGEPLKLQPKQMKLNAMNFREEHPDLAHLSDEQIAMLGQESREHRGRMLGETIAKAPIRALDLPQALASLATGFQYQPEYVSEKVLNALKERGINLSTQKPLSPSEKTITTGAEWAAGIPAGAGVGSLAGKGIGALAKGAKAIPIAEKGLSGIKKGTEFAYGAGMSPSEIGKWSAVSGGLGTGAGALESYGDVSPEKASLLGLAPVIPAAYKGIKSISNLAPSRLGERQAGRKISELIGEENIPAAREKLQALSKAPSKIGHKPFTAEAEVPAISQLHTALEGTPKHPELAESISSQKELNRLAKERAMEKLGAGKEYTTSEAGQAITGALEEELGKRTAARRKEVGPEYEMLKNMESRVKPESAISYIDTEIKGLPKGSKYIGPLEHAKKLISGESKESIILPSGEMAPLPSKINVLEKGISEIAENASKAYRAGDYAEARLLNNVVSRIYQDLEHAHPEVKEVRAKYAKASEPINKITEDPFFKKMLKESKHGIPQIKSSEVPSRFVHAALSSPSNTRSIKEVIGGNKDAWHKFQSGVANVVSSNSQTPHKFLQFFGKRQEALKDIFNHEQYSALEEIKDIYAKERKIASQAKTEGSPTAQRLAIMKEIENSPLQGTFLSQMITPTVAAIAGSTHGLPYAFAAAGASELTKWWNRTRSQSFQKTLQKFLLNPEEADLMLKKYDKSGIKEANNIAKKLNKSGGLTSVGLRHGKKSSITLPKQNEEED